MDKWEYLCIDYAVRRIQHVESPDKELNELLSHKFIYEAISIAGSQGWELVSAMPNKEDPYKWGMFIFKRQIK